jgi:hypothetical protein
VSAVEGHPGKQIKIVITLRVNNISFGVHVQVPHGTGLPGDTFAIRKYQFWYILEGSVMDIYLMFYCQLIYFVDIW